MREAGLAGAAEATDRHQPRLAEVQQFAGQGEIGPRFLGETGGLPGIALAARRRGTDVRADACPERQEKRERREPALVLRTVEIAVEHAIAELAVTTMVQVHQQECEIVEHIDGGDLVAELDRIKQGRLSIDEADVVQMQIAVAAADLALRAAPVEER